PWTPPCGRALRRPRDRSACCPGSSHRTRIQTSLSFATIVTCRGRLALARALARVECRRSAELLGESDEKPFRPADVAEPIHVFILDDFAHELRAALAEPLERFVDVVHG